jgi:S1-C subfamily serine protease
MFIKIVPAVRFYPRFTTNPIACKTYPGCFLCKAWASLLIVLLFSMQVHADVADTLIRIKPSVVGVGTYQALRNPRAQLKGTGFVVDDGKAVITCYHVVKPLLDLAHNESWVILLGQGRDVDFRFARVIAADPAHDLALMRFEGETVPPLKIGNESAAREGEQFYFTGYPIGSILGLNAATHRAGLAAIVPIYTPMAQAADLNVRAIRQASDPYRIFQLDAIAYPGNSGSPLWQPETGEVLGVVNSVFVKGAKEAALTDPSGISYAIPSRYIEALIKRSHN